MIIDTRGGVKPRKGHLTARHGVLLSILQFLTMGGFMRDKVGDQLFADINQNRDELGMDRIDRQILDANTEVLKRRAKHEEETTWQIFLHGLKLFYLNVKWDTLRFFGKIKTFIFIEAHQMERIPVDANPFNHDFSHMGTPLVRGWTVMHEGFDRKDDPMPLKYIIMVNTRTGNRVKIVLPQD